MKRLLVLFYFSIYCCSLFSQSQISGAVLSADKKPLEFALVSVFPLSDSANIFSTITDDKGMFQLEIPNEKSQLNIQMLGHETFSQLLESTANLDLGKVILKEEASLLQAVEVRAARSTVESHLGKKVLFIGQDLASTGSNALEAMEQIPAISTNSRGEVQVRGNSNVVIYVNGKETQRDPATLKFIAADVLQKIEVITNPSAKYDAEGVGGIINLVYKKNQWAQFKLEAVANMRAVTNPLFFNPSGAVNLSFNKNKFSFFCNASYDFDRYFSTDNYSRTHFSDDLNLYENDVEWTGEGSAIAVNTGISYEPDSTLSMGMEMNYDQWDYSDQVLQKSRFNFLRSPNQSFEIPNVINELENELWINFSLDKKFTPKHKMKLLLTTGGEVEDNDRLSEPIDFPNTSGETGQFLLSSDESESQRYYMGKLDFEFPSFGFGKLEAGTKLDIIDYDILQIAKLQSDSIRLPENDFKMDLQKLGLYLLQSHTFKKLEYEIGLRAEQFSSTAKQESTQEVFEQKYFLFFPSVQLNYLIDGRNHSLGFGFTRRISRPSFFDLNPFISYQDPLNLETGNPALAPEIGQLYELSYHRELKSWTFNSSLFQRITEEAIQKQVFSNGNQQTISKPVNIGKFTSTGVEMQLENRVGKWLKTTATMSAGKSKFEDRNFEISYNNKWIYRYGLQQQYLLSNQWKIQWSATYLAPYFAIQQRRAPISYFDLAINKKFKNKRGSISLSVKDIFNTKNYNYSLLVADFEVERRHKWQTRQITLGLRYTIVDNKK